MPSRRQRYRGHSAVPPPADALRGWSLRPAEPADATAIAVHRATMFAEMGWLAVSAQARLQAASEPYLRDAIASGEYVGWLAHATGEPRHVVGGAGLQRRPLLPRPNEDGSDVLQGLEGLIMNVYIEPTWRRRGIAEAMMREILAWAPAHGIVRVSLHASDAGRPLYERMGFLATNEMRFREPSG
jgi:GNAT superfamily N-acetyltransferase